MKTSSRTKVSAVTPNEIQPVTIRHARVDDIAGVKVVADRHKTELGFIRISVLHEAKKKGGSLSLFGMDRLSVSLIFVSVKTTTQRFMTLLLMDHIVNRKLANGLYSG